MAQLNDKIITIVAVGNFNPSIFQPMWFASEDLIRKQEAEAANIEVIREEGTVFSLEWVHIQVTHNRLTIRLLQNGFEEALKDLSLSIFKLLPHTPATFLGLNYEYTYSLASTDAWHALGDKLVPKEDIWNTFLPKPGMSSVQVTSHREGDPDQKTGKVAVRISPTSNCNNGISLAVNNHFVINPSGEDKMASFKDAYELFSNNWESSCKMAEEIYERVSAL